MGEQIAPFLRGFAQREEDDAAIRPGERLGKNRPCWEHIYAFANLSGSAFVSTPLVVLTFWSRHCQKVQEVLRCLRLIQMPYRPAFRLKFPKATRSAVFTMESSRTSLYRARGFSLYSWLHYASQAALAHSI